MRKRFNSLSHKELVLQTRAARQLRVLVKMNNVTLQMAYSIAVKKR